MASNKKHAFQLKGIKKSLKARVERAHKHKAHSFKYEYMNVCLYVSIFVLAEFCNSQIQCEHSALSTTVENIKNQQMHISKIQSGESIERCLVMEISFPTPRFSVQIKLKSKLSVVDENFI